MNTPTIVRQTKDYMLIKVPLPQRSVLSTRGVHNVKTTMAEKRLWRIIQGGEKEHRTGKTIKASSVDEALKIYEHRKKHKGC